MNRSPLGRGWLLSALLVPPALLLGAALLLGGVGCSSRDDSPRSGPTAAESQVQARRALEQGVRWLLAQQAADGGWHSNTYGQMRGGVGNTALVLYALAQLPDDLRRAARPNLDRGVGYLTANLDRAGFVRDAAGTVDYPTYATALLLTALDRLATPGWSKQREQMLGYLQAAQQTTRQGWTPNDPEYGGWNQTGGTETDVPLHGETNLSATRYALEALQASQGLDDARRAAALVFLSHCQNFDPAATGSAGDGGFYFTPTKDDPRNKAGLVSSADDAPQARSYGSATADGLLALLACGVPPDDPRCRAAIAWLDQHPATDTVPGFVEAEGVAQLREGLKFYYQSALAQCTSQVPELDRPERRIALQQSLIRQQRADGSWQNDSPLMHEDDPLVATAMAVTALGSLLKGNADTASR